MNFSNTISIKWLFSSIKLACKNETRQIHESWLYQGALLSIQNINSISHIADTSDSTSTLQEQHFQMK